jgi:hypothetical protein
MLTEAKLICMRKKKEYEWQEMEELQERIKNNVWCKYCEEIHKIRWPFNQEPLF